MICREDMLLDVSPRNRKFFRKIQNDGTPIVSTAVGIHVKIYVKSVLKIVRSTISKTNKKRVRDDRDVVRRTWNQVELREQQ